ncbi:DCC-interacting protein [Schistosoma japonicum]|uniref:DCC-interacting protein n=1 Tax=Schistosoma japonicum TaxID=6182 RepID=A0A4Z2CQD5_SCHJA|nr:DCC-interacting protein [Schistosoma japonicum]
MAARYYGHLNEAEQIRYLAPLIFIQTFITQKKNDVQVAHNLFSQGIIDSLITVAEESLHKYESSFNNMKRKSLTNMDSIEHKSLSYFCPEPWILNAIPNQACISKTYPREPNRRLLTKSGSLLMRTRVNLIWRWIEVYCLIQNGNFMYQTRGDIAASVLFDLNQKGVYAEATDVDDRRHVFLIASPTERKTILLQAESETERDEWISTIMNVISHTNNTDDIPIEEYSRALQHTEKKTDVTSPQVADASLRDYVNPVEHDLTYIDWFSNHLPQIHFDLNPIPELNILLDTELQVFCEENVEKHYDNTPFGTDNDNNSEAITDDTNAVDTDEKYHLDGETNNASHPNTGSCSNPFKFVNVDKLSNSFPCHFLGVVELPMDHFPQNQFNDIFTYVLSCRSASELPSPISCHILITKNNVWILSTKEHESEQNQKQNILLKIPFHAIRSWHNHPDNHKLGCLVVQGPLNDIKKFANCNGCIGFTFESDVSQMIIECILAAEFNRLDTLQDEKDQLERVNNNPV